MRLMMAWAHDWRCVPSRLANKIPVAGICRGTFLRANIVPPAVTTSPIDRPFDRRGRPRAFMASRSWMVDGEILRLGSPGTKSPHRNWLGDGQ